MLFEAIKEAPMSKRLLLADDSVTIQKVIGITFANEDYQLDIVDNGDSALEHARVQRPDMILADVYMPGKNGYELCAAVKQDPQLSSVPVMLLTGTFEPFDEDKARQAGADAWISKPFESQFLIDQVEELLAKFASASAVIPTETTPAAESWGDVADEDDSLLELADDELLEDIADEDVWGAVSLDEDDLLLDEELAVSEPLAPDSVVETVAPAAVAAAVDDDIWGDVDDEIFDLESDDIIDEADLLDDFADEIEPASEPLVSNAPASEPVSLFTAEDELLSEEPLELDNSFELEEPTQGGWSVPGAEMSALDPEPVDVVEADAEVITESATEPIFERSDLETASEPAYEHPVFEPMAVSEPAAAADITLDEDQVTKIVERIAAEVVERLAGSLLERIAWEVVPDLAESLIREEIRKIKANL
jgi:CheY-like chemotaxis protein